MSIIDPAARSSSSFPAHAGGLGINLTTRPILLFSTTPTGTCNVTQISCMTNACDPLGIHRQICKLWIRPTGLDRRSGCMCSSSSLQTVLRCRCWSELQVTGCSIFFMSRIWVFTFSSGASRMGLTFWWNNGEVGQ